MQPHEIKPDTELCTVIGYNAQTGYIRRYFNAILKRRGINATAIALNLNDDNFAFTMRSLPHSKVDRMMVEQEFSRTIQPFCHVLHDGAESRVDFVEVRDGEIHAYNLDRDVEALFDNPAVLDDRVRFVAKMMLIARRWYGANVDIDEIPVLIQATEKEE